MITIANFNVTIRSHDHGIHQSQALLAITGSIAYERLTACQIMKQSQQHGDTYSDTEVTSLTLTRCPCYIVYLICMRYTPSYVCIN